MIHRDKDNDMKVGNDNGDQYKEFLSHPIEKPKHSLLQHSVDVAVRTRELLSKTSFQNPELGYFSGLLHDIGKLNPFYQKLFGTEESGRKELQDQLDQKYARVHAPFSAWIAYKLLRKMDKQIELDMLDKIIMLIYGHHTRLHGSLGKKEFEKSEKFKNSKQEMFDNLRKFYQVSSEKPEFSTLSWNRCLTSFASDRVGFDIKLKPKSGDNSVSDFLQMSVAFSCLLQADRGSFSDWKPPKFDEEIDTSKLIRTESKLSYLRGVIQEELLNGFRYDQPITVISGPTGSGKTKVFLDIINQFQFKYNDLERIFYFSPLLALTEDFETELIKTIHDWDEILVYNHLFSGSIEEKRRVFESGQVYESQWIFENESFNRPFIITTTQRLLYTIYSNTYGDKLKLASFRNSLLIIDEVQTLPKYILRNLIKILEDMHRFLGTRTILVSATIPYELQSIPTTQPSEQTRRSYLDSTKKYLSFQCWSDLDHKTLKKGRTLVMANTRRKAVNIFDTIVRCSNCQHRRIDHNKTTISSEISRCRVGNCVCDSYLSDTMYLSSGIRKKDKRKILSQIHEKEKANDQYTLVSTQVVEAGVNISFSHIFRERAPLDSVIQVMGRLNREAEKDQAQLVVYEYDQDYKPYSELEQDESKAILKRAKDSIQLYYSLADYYKSVSEKNNLYKEYSQELDSYVFQLDFDETWRFINKYVLDMALENERDTVLIPDIDKWDEIKQIILRNRLTRASYRRFADISASLPKKIYDLGKIYSLDIENYFDAEALEKNILLPKKEYLHEIYDDTVGTDKWLISKNQ